MTEVDYEKQAIANLTGSKLIHDRIFRPDGSMVCWRWSGVGCGMVITAEELRSHIESQGVSPEYLANLAATDTRMDNEPQREVCMCMRMWILWM